MFIQTTTETRGGRSSSYLGQKKVRGQFYCPLNFAWHGEQIKEGNKKRARQVRALSKMQSGVS
ncbi:MAG: hypothetical protein Rhims3KO_02940 [Hyphomicrobiales bacterium]